MSKRKSKKLTDSKFKFRRHDRIGASDAQEDREILLNCFVDTGDLDVLADTSRPECIVLGRTGVGKTALISMLGEREDKVESLDPRDLALSYLSNRPMLNFFMEIGVDLELFFQVLWRHIIAIELIKLESSSRADQSVTDFFQRILEKPFTNRSKRIAQDYLRKYPDFWKDTEVLIRKETDSFEKRIQTGVSGRITAPILKLLRGEVALNRDDISKIGHEESAEIKQIGQQVVNKMQMRELTAVMDLLSDELLRDRQKKYYICIDKLDENWSSNVLRYRLIRALIESARDFNQRIPQLKVVCAIREDLFDRVFRFTRNQGDQQEKYRSLYLQLYWKPKELVDVLDLRVNQLLAHRYAKKQKLKIGDVLPRKVQQSNTVSYLIGRTLNTPRDVIMFFNECIKQAEGKTRITQSHVFAAERSYSELRLRALADEWSADYSTLGDAVMMLKGTNRAFRLNELDKREYEDRILDYWMKSSRVRDKDYIYNLVDEKMDFDLVIPEFLFILCQIGVVGVKKDPMRETFWSHNGKKIYASDINDDARFHIHPAFFSVLGVNP